MFGINLSEFFVIGILALILIGPKQLPQVARTIGRFMNELKRGADVFTEELKAQVKEDPQPLDSNLAKHDKPQSANKDPNVKDS